MTQNKLGILGGMGPLASLAFLRTIYAYNHPGAIEQNYPDILLHAISSTPDRTRALLGSDEDALADSLTRNLRTLDDCGVTRIVICCFTSHALIHRVPDDIREKIVSLVDITARELIARQRPALLLASQGSYQKAVFSSTVAAVRAAKYVVVPDEKDRGIIHGLIYDYLKPGKDIAPVYAVVRGLVEKYGLDSFIAGCTEFHLLSRYIEKKGISDIACVDPLVFIARRMDRILSKPVQMMGSHSEIAEVPIAHALPTRGDAARSCARSIPDAPRLRHRHLMSSQSVLSDPDR